MAGEGEEFTQHTNSVSGSEREAGRLRIERNRLIAHLGRVFSRRYDLQVLPSGQKGIWACGLDPKITSEITHYVTGQRASLDDIPPELFTPKQILFDEDAALKMSMDEINTLLHHEAGHAKYTDFRSMYEGQRHAKDEGHLPTSFWLTFEGIEDPRVNVLEGEESPAIDRLIRTHQAKALQDRITEAPLSEKPKMLQFAYDSFHRWLHGEGIPELQGTDVGRLGEAAKPLLEQYFQNTDLEQRRVLQQKIWDIAKELEKADVEEEEKRQMAQNQKSQRGQDGSGGAQQEQHNRSSQSSGDGEPQDSERKGFLEKLKESLFSQKDKPALPGESSQSKTKRLDISKLSPEELQEIQDAIDKLSPSEKAELVKKARRAVDEAQREALEKKLSKTLKMQRNKKTGEYEAIPQGASEKVVKQAQADFQQAVQQVEAEEQAEWERQEAEQKQQEEALRQIQIVRREKLEMEKAGFDEDERDKYMLYQSLEDSMYSYVRNFRRAMESAIPRKKEPVYESGYFSGSKFNRRDLVRKVPVGDERFYMRQVDRPTGEPRLFIGLLVDNSGSMEGKKMEEARKTMVFFARVCKEMGIPFMAAAFGDDAKIIKSFRQDFDNPAEKIKPQIIDATDASGGSTDMHAGIAVTIEPMNEQRRKLGDSHGIIFVISDGGANAGLTGDALRSYIEDNKGRLTFKAFGLSGNSNERDVIQRYLNDYFGDSNCAYPKGFEDLPDEAFRVLRVNLIQFQKYFA